MILLFTFFSTEYTFYIFFTNYIKHTCKTWFPQKKLHIQHIINNKSMEGRRYKIRGKIFTFGQAKLNVFTAFIKYFLLEVFFLSKSSISGFSCFKTIYIYTFKITLFKSERPLTAWGGGGGLRT